MHWRFAVKNVIGLIPVFLSAYTKEIDIGQLMRAGHFAQFMIRFLVHVFLSLEP